MIAFHKSSKITFSYCRWLAPIYKTTHLYTLHTSSQNVILRVDTKQKTKQKKTAQQQDKDMFFPFGGSVLCTCVCKHSFDSSSQMERTMCHTSKEIIQPNSVRTQSPHLGQLGSNRKQVIHLFCFCVVMKISVLYKN